MATMTTIKPMLCRLEPKPFNRKGWIFQPKLDGTRVLAMIQSHVVTLQSRDGRNITNVYPEVVETLQSLADAVLDGEIVVLDSQGRPDFNALQKRSNLSKSLAIKSAMVNYPAVFYAFDVLSINNIDCTQFALKDRLALLENLIKGLNMIVGAAERNIVRMTMGVEENGLGLWESIKKLDMEGIVAKRLSSHYFPGKRTADWVKIKKSETDEFVVMGYTKGTGSRAKTFGALVLGSYKSGKLEIVGKVGSGLTEKDLDLFLASMKPTGRLLVHDTEAVVEVEPELVVETTFMERTKTGTPRFPVFLRIRKDKSPREC